MAACETGCMFLSFNIFETYIILFKFYFDLVDYVSLSLVLLVIIQRPQKKIIND